MNINTLIQGISTNFTDNGYDALSEEEKALLKRFFEKEASNADGEIESSKTLNLRTASDVRCRMATHNTYKRLNIALSVAVATHKHTFNTKNVGTYKRALGFNLKWNDAVIEYYPLLFEISLDSDKLFNSGVFENIPVTTTILSYSDLYDLSGKYAGDYKTKDINAEIPNAELGNFMAKSIKLLVSSAYKYADTLRNSDKLVSPSNSIDLLEKEQERLDKEYRGLIQLRYSPEWESEIEASENAMFTIDMRSKEDVIKYLYKEVERLSSGIIKCK